MAPATTSGSRRGESSGDADARRKSAGAWRAACGPAARTAARASRTSSGSASNAPSGIKERAAASASAMRRRVFASASARAFAAAISSATGCASRGAGSATPVEGSPRGSLMSAADAGASRVVGCGSASIASAVASSVAVVAASPARASSTPAPTPEQRHVRGEEKGTFTRARQTAASERIGARRMVRPRGRGSPNALVIRGGRRAPSGLGRTPARPCVPAAPAGNRLVEPPKRESVRRDSPIFEHMGTILA